MIDRLESIAAKSRELEERLGNPEVVGNLQEYRKIAKEHAELAPLVAAYRRYRQLHEQYRNNQQMLGGEDDPEMKALIRDEDARLEQGLGVIEAEIKRLLLPKDPNDDKNVILEIRAGTGGDEAALFAADLFRMYTRYAEALRWKVEILGSHLTGIGGFKEVIASIAGKGAYSRLKFERGVHRVQRVPSTESQGRIHTSAVTVAILPEAEEIDVEIKQEDLHIDVFRSGGPGGQSVNTTDSAVRITHIPSGLVVSCQDEKSQLKNKQKGMKILRARLFEKITNERNAEIAKNRKEQVGSGDRSEKIRTYNFPDRRVTDHRVGLTVYNLEAVLDGEIQEFVDALYEAELAKD